MYCPACGSQNPDSARACAACGQAMGAAVGVPPTVIDARRSGSPVNAHLALSIIVTLFCCQPAGIVAIVYSAIAMGKNSSGDYAEAAKAAKTASLWGWIGFGLGITVWVIYGVFMLLMLAATAAGSP